MVNCKLKTKPYWKFVPGEVFKTSEMKSFMRLDIGSIYLECGAHRGKIFYFLAKEEMYELFNQTIELRGLAVVNEFGDIVAEGSID